jgi:U3 small nucleolar RNA-associated protein 14
VVQEPEQKRDRDAQQRKITAMVMKKNLKKWLPIVKHNREADHIDFTKTKNVP